MSPVVKTAFLEALEEVTKVTLEQSVKVSEAYASDKKSALALGLAQGFKLAYNGLLKDLADKINPAD